MANEVENSLGAKTILRVERIAVRVRKDIMILYLIVSDSKVIASYIFRDLIESGSGEFIHVLFASLG